MRCVSLAFLLLTGCMMENEFNIENIPPPVGDLMLTGRVCHPVTHAFVPDALVYTHLYDSKDIVYDSRSDYSDENGFFQLEELVADRDYEVYVQVGHDIIDKFIVSLGGQDVVMPPTGCLGDADMQVAVISGAWDDLAGTLEAAGVRDVHRIDGQTGSEILDFLTDPEALAGYDMIFFDGGHREEGVIYGAGPTWTVRDNLRQYVEGGGIVFATDWAYDVVEQTWPSEIDFYGDDAQPDAAQVGDVGTLLATVIDPMVRQEVGGLQSVVLTYDLPVWPVIAQVRSGVDVWIEGDAPFREGLGGGTLTDAPMLVRFREGDGQVILSTWRATVDNDAVMVGVLRTLIEADP